MSYRAAVLRAPGVSYQSWRSDQWGYRDVVVQKPALLEHSSESPGLGPFSVEEAGVSVLLVSEEAREVSEQH